MTFRGFSAFRLLTSSARWLYQLAQFFLGARFVLVSMPIAANQFIFDRENKKVSRVRIATYYDWATLLEVFARREYLPSNSQFTDKVIAVFHKLNQQGGTPLILDLGANIGASSILFSKFFSGSRIVAVEPAIENLERLAMNVENFEGVQIVDRAISRTSEDLRLFADKEGGNNAFRTFDPGSDDPEIGRVQAIAITDLIGQHQDATPFILKVDIEGFEAELFSGSTDWVDDFPVIMIEIHDWMLPGKALSQNVFKVLSQGPRDVVISGENLLAIAIER